MPAQDREILRLLVIGTSLARPAAAAMGASGHTLSLATAYLRISSLGLPFALIALAGQGYLRGVASTRSPLAIVVAGNAANVAIEVVFVYGFGLGIAGSAWAPDRTDGDGRGVRGQAARRAA